MYVGQAPVRGCSFEELEDEIELVLENSFNFSSPNFLGFPDAGNSVAALSGALVEALAQQNMNNSTFAAKAATFVEVATVCWLRRLAQFPEIAEMQSVLDVGGVAVTGGTMANLYGILMARKRFNPTVSKDGLRQGKKVRILIPAGLTHYSVVGGVAISGMGTDAILPVPTRDYRYDLQELDRILRNCLATDEYPICVVINAGDSRTLSIEKIDVVIDLVKEHAPDAWIHIDACHGGQLLFSKERRSRLQGIERADSISLDPHKVLSVPYTCSYFLVRDTSEFVGFCTSSTLVMDDPWSLGQLTPGIGSKSFSSLKLYLQIKKLGLDGMATLVDRRCALAEQFYHQVEADGEFQTLLDVPDINSVPFVYIGGAESTFTLDEISRLNKAIYARMTQLGIFYFHGFLLKNDSRRFKYEPAGKIFCLRFMSGNPEVTSDMLRAGLEHIKTIGREIVSKGAP
nr:pyridoxal-dependent decarboxylase [Sinorhizobium sp. 7-81]